MAAGKRGHCQPPVCPRGVYGPSTVGGRGCVLHRRSHGDTHSPCVVTAGAGVPMPQTQTLPDTPLLMGSVASDTGLALRSRHAGLCCRKASGRREQSF